MPEAPLCHLEQDECLGKRETHLRAAKLYWTFFAISTGLLYTPVDKLTFSGQNKLVDHGRVEGQQCQVDKNFESRASW